MASKARIPSLRREILDFACKICLSASWIAPSHPEFTLRLHLDIISLDLLLDIAIILRMAKPILSKNQPSYFQTYTDALEELAELMNKREELDDERERIDTRLSR